MQSINNNKILTFSSVQTHCRSATRIIGYGWQVFKCREVAAVHYDGIASVTAFHFSANLGLPFILSIALFIH